MLNTTSLSLHANLFNREIPDTSPRHPGQNPPVLTARTSRHPSSPATPRAKQRRHAAPSRVLSRSRRHAAPPLLRRVGTDRASAKTSGKSHQPPRARSRYTPGCRRSNYTALPPSHRHPGGMPTHTPRQAAAAQQKSSAPREIYKREEQAGGGVRRTLACTRGGNSIRRRRERRWRYCEHVGGANRVSAGPPTFVALSRPRRLVYIHRYRWISRLATPAPSPGACLYSFFPLGVQ